MKVFLEKLESVKREVDKTLSTSPLIIRGYTKHLLQSEGKYIRAKAVLAAALCDDGSIHEDAVKFAAAIELLHLASLVHDDVMDDADTRRGVITLHKKYGRKTAIICGDYIMAVAMSMAGSVSQKEAYLNFEFANYMESIALGELLQHINNGNVRLTIKEYLEIIDGKTAKLFEASLFAGAMSALVEAEFLELYRELGYSIGMIFQLLDDVSDFEDSQDLARKPVQSDYEQGVITLPLIYGFEEDPSMCERAATQSLTRAQIKTIVKKANGVARAKAMANDYYENGQTLLNSLEMTQEKRTLLLAILNQAMRR